MPSMYALGLFDDSELLGDGERGGELASATLGAMAGSPDG